ncbi:transporter substrate-binding domain-containing protein [Chromobacterium sp. IIBBL 290-4]|uniref:transporter substrate-binding domain-containing protein n=1 Tax=Chromobacterium sp. IIBBL 290-4 TaxID=2953890 RepID=UPI0020B65B7E|nr:transporter substrate-binding domain-containing protein [Chromobacterium sp. IIBBL 290-4]UTH73021.1 transporter substrate-binding domain-containing protein [Chromobacterium sp. IIBBL 290-4]
MSAHKSIRTLLTLAATQAWACNGTITPETASRVDAPDLHGIAVFLPQVLENSESGPFAELLKTIARHYPDGKISFEIKPVKRVYLDTDDRGADFRFPIMKVRDNADSATPYQFSHEMMGKVTFVLYSNKAKPLRKIDILRSANLARYDVEAPPVNWGFPTKSVVNLELSLKQLNLGRVDAVLWAQEEADYLVRKNGLNYIHREHFDDFPDVLFMSCNRRGDFVNQAISRAIRAARASGELQKAYAKVHSPYQDWQP